MITALFKNKRWSNWMSTDKVKKTSGFTSQGLRDHSTVPLSLKSAANQLSKTLSLKNLMILLYQCLWVLLLCEQKKKCLTIWIKGSPLSFNQWKVPKNHYQLWCCHQQGSRGYKTRWVSMCRLDKDLVNMSSTLFTRHTRNLQRLKIKW